MRAVDLCAGAGGLSLGLRRAGWDVLGVELDGDACATHRANVGPCDQASLHDWHPSGDVDAIAAGVPCQSFSQAGKREGTADPRGQLYLQVLRIAAEARARAILIENVRGLIGRGLDEIRLAFAAAGWQTQYALLDAADYGVPQHRRRLFLLGTRQPLPFTWPAPTHGPGGLLGLRPWVTVRDALGLAMDEPSPTVSASEHHSGRMQDEQGKYYRHASERIAQTLRASALDEPAPCVSAGGTGGGGGPEPFANAKQRGRLTAALIEGGRSTGKGWQGMRVMDPDAPAYSVSTTCAELIDAGLLDRPATAIQAGAGGRLSPAGHHERQFPALAAAGLLDRPAGTVDTTNGIAPAGVHERNRRAVRLSVAQLAALQSFPPDFVFTGTLTSQHRQVGNAVPPLLAEAMGRAVLEGLAL